MSDGAYDAVFAARAGGAKKKSAPPKPKRFIEPLTNRADTGPEIPVGSKVDPRWTSLAHGKFREDQGPAAIRLPDEVVRDMNTASNQTRDDGLEHGGNVVRTRGSDYNVRPGGTSDDESFYADKDDVGWFETKVGEMHSHPDTTAFSPQDIANMADDTYNIDLLQSLDGQQRMLVRTKEFQAMVDQVDAIEDHEERRIAQVKFRQAMLDTYNAAYAQALAGKRENHDAATEAATRATVEKFHLLYYTGRDGKLKRVGQQADSKSKGPASNDD